MGRGLPGEEVGSLSDSYETAEQDTNQEAQQKETDNIHEEKPQFQPA